MREAKKALRGPTRRWFNATLKSFDLDLHHQRLLLMACQQWDRSQAARETIEAEGAFINDRFGQRKEHPALKSERDSMIAFSRILREIGLDISQPEDSRPVQRPGGY